MTRPPLKGTWQNALSFFFLVSYLKLPSGEREDLGRHDNGIQEHLNIVVGEVKGPSSYTEQTRLNTNLFNITHHIICYTILLNSVVKILGKK